MQSVSHGYAIRLTANQNLEPLAGDLQQHFDGCTVKVDTNHEVTLLCEERIPLSPVLQYLDGKGISAVSYTHLDVYKRQLTMCATPAVAVSWFVLKEH